MDIIKVLIASLDEETRVVLNELLGNMSATTAEIVRTSSKDTVLTMIEELEATVTFDPIEKAIKLQVLEDALEQIVSK